MISNIRTNKIACIGAGYVGGPTMTTIAYKCPHIDVYVVDINQEKIDMWNSDNLPIYEPNLEEHVFVCRNRNLFFTTDIENVINECDIIFVSVNTPTKTSGLGAGKASDLSYWESCARMIAKNSTTSKIVIEKSTVPVKTSDAISKVLKANSNQSLDIQFIICSNPEFLAEGTAMKDLSSPDRVLIGAPDTDDGQIAQKIVGDIYRNWVEESKIIFTNLWSSELSKLAANAFLAQRVSSINSIANICELTGANIEEVSNAIGTDTRIGNKFITASVGYGGSCFKKDILSLIYIAEQLGLYEVANYWNAVVKFNEFQKVTFSQKIIKALFSTISGKKIVILGTAFKKNTGDVRETAALTVCSQLMNEGAILHWYDPKVQKDALYKEFVSKYGSMYNFEKLNRQLIHVLNVDELFIDAHAVVCLTEWDEFKNLDFENAHQSMHKPASIFDGRNILDHNLLFKIGFDVYPIGKTPLIHKY